VDKRPYWKIIVAGWYICRFVQLCSQTLAGRALYASTYCYENMWQTLPAGFRAYWIREILAERRHMWAFQVCAVYQWWLFEVMAGRHIHREISTRRSALKLALRQVCELSVFYVQITGSEVKADPAVNYFAKGEDVDPDRSRILLVLRLRFALWSFTDWSENA